MSTQVVEQELTNLYAKREKLLRKLQPITQEVRNDVESKINRINAQIADLVAPKAAAPKAAV